MLNFFYRSLNIKSKLSLILVLSSIMMSLVVGIYFDHFLRQSFSKTAEQRISYAFQRINLYLIVVENDLKTGISFIQNDESLLASVELVNKYQDKLQYDSILIDEEKKRLAEELLSRVKLSLNNDIALYDAHEELIANVCKTPKGYYLTYISFEEGKPVFYSRYEDEYDYIKRPFKPERLTPFNHIPYYTAKNIALGGLVTYHRLRNNLVIKSHQSLFEKGNKHIIAHIEMSRNISEPFFKGISNDLGMKIWSKATSNRSVDLASLGKINPAINEEEKHFVSAMVIGTRDGDLTVYTAFEKASLESILQENRKTFFILIVTLTLLSILFLQILFKRGISQALTSLMNQIQKIEKQDYSDTNIVHTGDELETISKNVNRLALSVQEREVALIASQKQLEALSNTDPLTDLPNRRLFNVLVQHGIDVALRNKDHLAVIFLDLDQFKQVNDTLGHNVGDTLLQMVAQRLRKIIRQSDTLARIGGDEFNMLIEGFQNRTAMEPILQKIIESFNLPFICADNEIRITASMGIALFPDDGESILKLTKNADLAMYRAKDTGRNRYSFFSQELADVVEERGQKIHALKKALERGGEFKLLYQPKVLASTGMIEAVEALIRWNSSELGWVTPDRFIQLSEETGLIVPIGAWILRQACEDFMRLRQEGYVFAYIAVNVSAVQLQRDDFFEMFSSIIAQTQIDPSWLEIEITESYLATNAHQALATLSKIRAMNIKIAIDDFGTGYSSLSYLQKLPVDRLKIDKSFVDEIPHSPEGVAVTLAIIALAKTFALAITAEGVETQEQLEFLRDEECDEIQGYYYAKPLGIDELKIYIENQTKA